MTQFDPDVHNWIHNEPVLPPLKATKAELTAWIEEQTRMINKVRHLMLDFVLAAMLQMREKVAEKSEKQ